MIVVDASVLADALVDDGAVGEAARAELSGDPHWAAPGHLLVEVVSVIRGKVLGRKLGLVRAREAIETLPSLVIDEVGTAMLLDRMWQLRGNVTAYDAAYVAAAELLACPLVTGDGRLAKASGTRCEIRLIAPS
ncbi:VapC toxin family PIN domain ribonuclease [Micromonospora globispora]|uniref:Ribonuclease VapC n=1 Tax=Micromonospora globispora TaxID=1450148 RepID=A0A317KE08_9ACTN|nr:type II toxin-antitoxin system VapC family toxin [Micromonospora globispora]PWU49771.1 VapC toxin family PIN domain ribonuclease [Micromonospora globispora]PWU54698.1 VapC toxin family PIN domain ribonuclease [Micromonospora globispora]RQW82032.1 VapC toxin family PIN domain ribonuclease [Micromonospora globispora]